MRVLELVKGMSMSACKLPSQSLKAQSFPTMQPSPSGVLPVNTLLNFRDKKEQDWLDDERQEPEDWAGSDVFKVGVDRSAFEQSRTDDEVETSLS